MNTRKLGWLLLGLGLVSPPAALGAEGCSCAEATEEKIDALVGEELARCVRDLAGEIKKPETPAELRGACEGVVKHGVERQKWLDSLPGGPREYLLVDHSNFDDYFFAFSVGYEFTSINETFGKGFPRMGLMVHRSYSEWLSMSGQFLLTSSAEQSLQDGTQPQGEDSEAVKTLEWEVQPFVALLNMPAHLSGADGEQRTIHEKIGFTAALGGRKTDQMQEMDLRRYAGLRAAFNPYTYIDLLAGKTESLDSRRVEFRGQMPVLKFANGSRFYIGGVVNMAIDNRDRLDERDVVRIYVKWDSPDFSSLLGLGSE